MPMTMTHPKWPGKRFMVQKASYVENNATALIILDAETGERYWTATVNMEDLPAEGCVWIKTWSENEGVMEMLVAAGLIRPTGGEIQAGFAIAYEAELIGELALS